MSTAPAAKRSKSLLDELGYLPEDKAAIAMKVKPKTLTEYRKDGRGPKHAIIGRKIYYAKDELMKWIAAGGTKDSFPQILK